MFSASCKRPLLKRRTRIGFPDKVTVPHRVEANEAKRDPQAVHMEIQCRFCSCARGVGLGGGGAGRFL